MILITILTGSTILCVLRWNVWFTTPEEPVWQGDTLSMRFRTFNDDSVFSCQYSDTLSMVLLGDIHNTLQDSDYQFIATHCPDMQCYAQLGDFVEREQFYYKQLLKHQLHGTPFDTLPLLVCPGNHEYTKGIRRQLPQSWYQSFPLPLNGPLSGLGSTYYVDFRHMRFIVIDTEDPQLISEFTRLNTWTKSAIASALQPWIIVMMHRPVFASRHGRINPTIWLSMVNALQGADIVFSGHDHAYARRGKAIQYDYESHHPVWIGVTSTTHARRPKTHSKMDTIVAGGPFYEYLRVTEHELIVRSCSLDSACIDSVALYRR